MSSSPTRTPPNPETQTWPVLTDTEIDRARPSGRVRRAELGESGAPLKAEYICADLSSRPQLFPCGRAADHTYSEKWPAASRASDLSTMWLGPDIQRVGDTRTTTDAALGCRREFISRLNLDDGYRGLRT